MPSTPLVSTQGLSKLRTSAADLRSLPEGFSPPSFDAGSPMPKPRRDRVSKENTQASSAIPTNGGEYQLSDNSSENLLAHIPINASPELVKDDADRDESQSDLEFLDETINYAGSSQGTPIVDQPGTQRVSRVDPALAFQLYKLRRQQPATDGHDNLPDNGSVQVLGTPTVLKGNVAISSGEAAQEPADESVDSFRVPETRPRRKNYVVDETPVRSHRDTSQSHACFETPRNHTKRRLSDEHEVLVAHGGSTADGCEVVVSYAASLCRMAKWKDNNYYPVAITDEPRNLDALYSNNPAARVSYNFGTGHWDHSLLSELSLPLDFTVGEQVNMDYNGRVGVTFKILSLLQRRSDSEMVTVSGHDALVLALVPNGSDSDWETTRETLVEADVADVYLRPNNFTHWKTASRERLLGRMKVEVSSTALTLSSHHGGVQAVKRARDSVSARPQVRVQNRHLFKDCVFAITNSNPDANQDDVDSLGKLIRQSGGVVLENGADDALTIRYSSSTISWSLGNDVKFAAVLSPGPTKTPKYLEAIAMGWPCLSFEFVAAAVETGQFPHDFQEYVLAAGDSLILGASKSLDVSDFVRRWSNGLTLKDQFMRRKLFLGPIASPIYLLGDLKSSKSLLNLLILATSHPPKRVERENKIPHGAIVIMADKDAPGLTRAPTLLRNRLTKYAIQDNTVVFAREWLIQCIINQSLV